MNFRLSTRAACGLALLVAAVVLLALTARWVLPQLGLEERFTRPVATTPGPSHIVARLENGTRLVMPYQSPAPTPVAAGPCGFEPLLAPANPKDGFYQLTGADAQLPDASAYLRVARDAAAASRLRDSEVALIMACRLATGAGEPDPAQADDVRKRLARLYLDQARFAGAHEAATVYRQRALYLLEERQRLEEQEGSREPT